ncbi:MAG: hypothetical protein Q8S84_00425 [bacterium]|nr:hypothetical protein [bacterium]
MIAASINSIICFIFSMKNVLVFKTSHLNSLPLSGERGYKFL